MHYIFDVDGTLTPSRQPMDFKFASFFEHFATHHAVYYVTGSSRNYTEEQLGPLYNLAIKSYQCAGCEVWQANNLIREKSYEFPDSLYTDLSHELGISEFEIKTGNHYDKRPGMLNFSVLGRNASLKEREIYVNYDNHVKEREGIAGVLSTKYPELNFSVAGETGIDILPRGWDKSQILVDFNVEDVVFFGDKTRKGGNDHEIATAVIAGGGIVHTVDDWMDTWQILSQL